MLKDTHDGIVAKATDDIRQDLATYGLQISRARVTLFSLRKRNGRYFQLLCDGSFEFPPTWDRQGMAAESVARLQIRLIALKKDMEAMSAKIAAWTLRGNDGFDREVMVPTLASPVHSPSKLAHYESSSIA